MNKKTKKGLILLIGGVATALIVTLAGDFSLTAILQDSLLTVGLLLTLILLISGSVTLMMGKLNV